MANPKNTNHLYIGFLEIFKICPLARFFKISKIQAIKIIINSKRILGIPRGILMGGKRIDATNNGITTRDKVNLPS